MDGTVAVVESQAESDVEEDDQTEALLKGFESSDENDASGDEGFEKGQEVPSLPANKKLQKKLKGAKDIQSDSPGIIYVGFVVLPRVDVYYLLTCLQAHSSRLLRT